MDDCEGDCLRQWSAESWSRHGAPRLSLSTESPCKGEQALRMEFFGSDCRVARPWSFDEPWDALVLRVRRLKGNATLQLCLGRQGVTFRAAALRPAEDWTKRGPAERPNAGFVGDLLAKLAPADREWGGLVDNMLAAWKHRDSVTAFASSLGLGGGVTGYVYHTIPVAVYSWLRHYGDFRAALEAALDCGGDTDTGGGHRRGVGRRNRRGRRHPCGLDRRDHRLATVNWAAAQDGSSAG